MAINSKKKGSRNERNLSKLFQSWTGYEFARTPSSGGLRWKKSDNVVGDIVCSDQDHSRIFPFSVETKFHDDINFSHLLLGNTRVEIQRFWEQTLSDSVRSEKIPLLLMRYNGMPSDMYFAVTNNSLFRRLSKINPNKFGSLSSSRGYTIFNSYDLFKMPYKSVLTITETYRNDC